MWSGSEQEVRIIPAVIKQFYSPLHPGAIVADNLVVKAVAGH